jgi:hypothetical protein
MLRRHAELVAVVACIASVGFAGCGKTSNSSSSKAPPAIDAAKSKFLIHAGLALGSFDHFIYGPFKAVGTGGPQSHKLVVTQAVPAALFVHNDLMLAAEDVKSSPTVGGLYAPLTSAASMILALRTKFLHGTYNSADINSANASLAQVKVASATMGVPIENKFISGEQPSGAITHTR